MTPDINKIAAYIQTKIHESACNLDDECYKCLMVDHGGEG